VQKLLVVIKNFRTRYQFVHVADDNFIIFEHLSD